MDALIRQQTPPQQPRQTPRKRIAKRAQITAHRDTVYRCLEDLRILLHRGAIQEDRVADDLDEDDGGADVGSRERAEETGADVDGEEGGGGGGGADGDEDVACDGGDPVALGESADEDEEGGGEGEEGEREEGEGAGGVGEGGGEEVEVGC